VTEVLPRSRIADLWPASTTKPRGNRKLPFVPKRQDVSMTVLGCVRYWIGVPQDRDKWRALVNAVLNLRVPYNAGKFSSGCTTGGPSCGA
jgi:hypothetical protein